MPAAASKTRRQQMILHLLRTEPIGRQEDLVRRLLREGVRVAQSTLSRDLRELRVSRVSTAQGTRYAVLGAEGESGARRPGAQRLRAVTAQEVTRVDANEVSVVVRTLSGRAQGVGAFLDGCSNPEILGTIAGDDTILVLPRSTRRTGRLRKAIAELFNLGGSHDGGESQGQEERWRRNRGS